MGARRRSATGNASGDISGLSLAELPTGAIVLVTNGISKGIVGRIECRARLMFGDEPTYLVALGGLIGDRVIRATYLREVPR